MNFSNKMVNSFVKKYVVCILLVLSYSIAQDPVVNVPQGRIVGTKIYLEKSLVPIEVYYGIPYATPPLGRYRFAAPERHVGWRRTYYAHRIPPRCPDSHQSETNFSEDCLFINIWTTRPAERKPLPVLVILYSESWTKGGVPLPCQELAAEGIVVVTVGFRLSVLGFFNLGVLAARGNLALLDQYMALLWVKDNISAFGGDPAAITVLGYAAGADSLMHHIASPRTYGLFQRVIFMSPANIWKLIDEQETPTAIEIQNVSREIAFFLGCRSKIDQEILHCMRTRPLTDILSQNAKNNWTKTMAPVSEDYLPEPEQYLPTSVYNALSDKHKAIPLDMLLGIVDLDVAYNDVNQHLKYNATMLSDYIDHNVIPELLKKFSLDLAGLHPILAQAIRWEYGYKNIESRNHVDNLLDYLARIESSAKSGAGVALVAARLARQVSRLYVYRYTIPGKLDLNGKQINVTSAVHGSDLIALLGDALVLQVSRRTPTSDERLYSSIFRRYIIHFIKYGQPEEDYQWQRYQAGDARIYKIVTSDGTAGIKEDNTNRDSEFWLYYLHELASLFESLGNTEKLTTLERDESRLRGGVFAMCGVAVVLLLLLFFSAVILQRQRSKRRFSITDSDSRNK